MYSPNAVPFEQTAGSRRWRKQVLWIYADAHRPQAFDDRSTRSSGGVGQIADSQTGISQLTHSFGHTRDGLAGLVQDAFQIE
jgi:hypothetical protein